MKGGGELHGSLEREPLERMLGRLLQYGTYAASSVIALGLVLSVASIPAGQRVATVGIGLFIVLPVARVGVMAIYFTRARDYRFGAIAALVIIIIACSYLAGAR
jgi:uncharacterized membrane protein